MLIFLVTFITINIHLLRWISKIEINTTPYSTEYVRTTVRGILGKFESNTVLENKRQYLQKSNSKF